MVRILMIPITRHVPILRLIWPRKIDRWETQVSIITTMDHDVFDGKSGQEIKDMLFALIGRPDRIGEKNTPPRFGKNMEEIKESILRIMKAQAEVLPAYGGNVEDNQEEGMPRKKKETPTESEETPVPKKRIYKKKVESPPAQLHLPLAPFHFPTGHIQFLVNMDVLSCSSVEKMAVHTSHKKQYAYNPVTELYHPLGKDGKMGEGIETI